jgi:hypothetical protein
LIAQALLVLIAPRHSIASALKAGLNERALKKYRTRRRRIRSYFGSESNISQVALTVGAKMARQGHISGFFLGTAGYSGVSLR